MSEGWRNSQTNSTSVDLLQGNQTNRWYIVTSFDWERCAAPNCGYVEVDSCVSECVACRQGKKRSRVQVRPLPVIASFFNCLQNASLERKLGWKPAGGCWKDSLRHNIMDVLKVCTTNFFGYIPALIAVSITVCHFIQHFKQCYIYRQW